MEEFEYKSGNYLFKLDEEHSIITVLRTKEKLAVSKITTIKKLIGENSCNWYNITP
ncbi:hypothetical protein [Niallia circulans]|uniref:hypothetical protein n=1 Tax=Niallia circulans TaxID=1397 RepID=UPI0015617618|nr:hypothetical protein [Niallia circulans]NRG34581.1 hypothetical protein [Niallia circulans]